jgi:enoyl-[acyl-carrier protein] reductase II
MSQVSKAKLVAAICEAGGFGILAAGGRRPESIEAEIRSTRALTGENFGVNVVTLDQRIHQQLAVCVESKVSHIILGGGIPNSALIATAKSNGAKVICFAPSLPIGERLMRAGADALVVEGHEAGGHVGPVAAAALAQEMLPLIQRGVLVFIAGGIGTGEAVASYLALGMTGCQLGTRFLCSVESEAHPATKAVYLRAASRDAVLSPQLDPRLKFIPVRAIANVATEDFIVRQRELLSLMDAHAISQREANVEIEAFWSGRLQRAMRDGDTSNGSLMAGQSVGTVVREDSVYDIISELQDRAATALGRLAA